MSQKNIKNSSISTGWIIVAFVFLILIISIAVISGLYVSGQNNSSSSDNQCCDDLSLQVATLSGDFYNLKGQFDFYHNLVIPVTESCSCKEITTLSLSFNKIGNTVLMNISSKCSFVGNNSVLSVKLPCELKKFFPTSTNVATYVINSGNCCHNTVAILTINCNGTLNLYSSMDEDVMHKSSEYKIFPQTISYSIQENCNLCC